MALNVEIKARCIDLEFVRSYLLKQGARHIGCDHQEDIYYQVPKGRLKLRKGNIESNLIQYVRANQAGPKQSNFSLFPVDDGEKLGHVLSNSLNTLVTVKKSRDIYYIENVKFQLDTVDDLGTFVEIEATNLIKPEATESDLDAQCNHYLQELGILTADLIDVSYSDLLLAKQKTKA